MPQEYTRRERKAEAVEAVIRARRFNYLDEDGLQFGLACSLTAAGFDVLREVRLTKTDRIDLLVNGNIGIEVKVAGSPAVVLRQLTRYARSAKVAELLLVTPRALHELMPDQIDGVPVRVVRLSWM